MPTDALTDDQLRQFYALYSEKNPNPDWAARYAEAINSYAELDEPAFSTPEMQERLWRERRITPVGPGEAVQTQGAYDDPEVVDSLQALRERVWPAGKRERAAEIQREFDRLLSLVAERHSGQRPKAKLGRVFAALLPADLNSCLNWKSNRKLSQLVLGPSANAAFPSSAVRVRARLRELLGEEPDLAEQVRRSTFCWWLQANADSLLEGDELGLGDEDSEPGLIDDPDRVEKISLWAANKQLRGISAIGGYVETYRAVVRAAEGGASPEDIAATLEADTEGLSLKTCRSLFNRVRRFGFLENRDGLWHPSDVGNEFVEEDPADVFVEKLIIRVFGPAHLLRILAQGSLPKKAAYAELRKIYPAWTSNMAPSSVGGWLRSLALVEELNSGDLALTEYGQKWEKRLPLELPVPPLLNAVNIDSTSATVEAREWPTIAQVREAFASDEELCKFVFSPGQLDALHLAWNFHDRKRFAILSGLSGTGKTALLLHYARVVCGLMDLDLEAHCSVVAVSPDWTDPSGLLGYVNALHADPSFQAEAALRLVIDASRTPDLPFFLILDEMNLARVERYLAPFLSAMETGNALVLHTETEAINGVPPSVPWPKNLFLGGTVNMDETTHPFSDKVLDRAFTLEFWEVDLPAYFERRAQGKSSSRLTEVEAVLIDVNQILRGVRRHFGYRSADEVLSFVELGVSGGAADVWPLVDQALFSKVLPRVRGEHSGALENAIGALAKLFEERGLTISQRKISEMEERLLSTGITRFWS